VTLLEAYGQTLTWCVAWIDSYEKDEPVPASRATDLLLPPQAHSAQHHFSTSRPERRRSQDGYVSSDDEAPSDNPPRTPDRGLFGAKEPVRGRKWDHARQGDPVIVPASSKTIYQWKTFIHSSMYGPPMDEEAELVDPSFLDEQTPGYRKPWCGDAGGEDPEKLLGLSPRKKKQRVWYERMQYTLVMHPLVPLLFRVIVLTTSTLALGLSCSIYHLTHYSPFPQNPSTIMAIVVDAVALPYIGYITWDEYTGKPLGLRSPKAKISLVLLDLFFIVFESANLALAFDALKNTSGSCQPGTNGTNYTICSRVQTLSSFLFIALVAWILTFSVSILRLVERVGSRDGKDDS
jgi:hypothetical protein